MAKKQTDELYLTQVVKPGGLGNTTLVGNLTIRTCLTLILVVGVGFLLWQTPMFHKNWPAILAYIALANLVLGHTPTGRNLLTNLYGIVFKKPANMLVTEEMTTTSVGHGISEAACDEIDFEAPVFRMAGSKHYAIVYNITSGIGYWSSEQEKVAQARLMKSLYNIMEGGESLLIALKNDNDTGMLRLREHLLEQENYEGDDLEAMSIRRASLLYSAGASNLGRSVQQYAILLVKPKNVNRVVSMLKKTSRITRPATNPMDVLLSVMGFEAGVERVEGGDIQ